MKKLLLTVVIACFTLVVNAKDFRFDPENRFEIIVENLQLSEEQVVEIKPIFDANLKERQALVERHREEVREMRSQSREMILAYLTEEQRGKFVKKRDRRNTGKHRKHHGCHQHDGPAAYK